MRAIIACILAGISLLTGLWGNPGKAEAEPETVVLREATKIYSPYAEMEVLTDPGGQLKFEDIRKPEWDVKFVRNRDEVPNYGYAAPVHWLRFSVSNASEERGWLLQLDYPPLDRVELYIVSESGDISHMWSGDSIPFSNRDVKNRNISFELMLDPGYAATLYVRVETEGAMALPIKLIHPVEFAQHEQLNYLLLGGYYGILLIMVIYNSIMAFSFRSRVFFTYVVINLSNLLLYSSLNGIAFQYFWPEAVWWNNRAIVFFMCVSHLAALLFTSQFLDVQCRHPRLYKVFRGFILLEAVNIAVLFVSYKAGLLLVTYSVPIIQVVLIAAGVLGLKAKFRPARYFMIGWGVFLIGAILSTLSDAGYVPMLWWTTYASQIGSTFEAVVLSWGLAYQIQVMRKEKEFAVAQMKESRRLADSDDLTGLYNRRYVIRAFEEAAKKPESMPITLLMLDLDHFKQVNDTLGHDAGDLVLKKFASILEHCFRPTDIIGRFGGEEFMVLLTHTNAEQARSAAEYVLKSIREHRFKVKDQTLGCTASLGLAQWNETEREPFEHLLRRADQALYEAKRSGRNRVCVSREAWPLEA
ncbi:diguanylate cyclase [Paenibacillus sp. HJGM_3]|uniref:sensor domain-containing diguanylate cyclase n=1 Tax=Paenibacillus sp. HJGM_3 TaxID=3379816 RepID=UPI003868B17B